MFFLPPLVQFFGSSLVRGHTDSRRNAATTPWLIRSCVDKVFLLFRKIFLPLCPYEEILPYFDLLHSIICAFEVSNALYKFVCVRFFRTPHRKKCCHIYLRQRWIVSPPIVRSVHLGFSRSTCSGCGIVGTKVLEGWRSILVAGGHGCCYVIMPCFYKLLRSTLVLTIFNATFFVDVTVSPNPIWKFFLAH